MVVGAEAPEGRPKQADADEHLGLRSQALKYGQTATPVAPSSPRSMSQIQLLFLEIPCPSTQYHGDLLWCSPGIITRHSNAVHLWAIGSYNYLPLELPSLRLTRLSHILQPPKRSNSTKAVVVVFIPQLAPSGIWPSGRPGRNPPSRCLAHHLFHRYTTFSYPAATSGPTSTRHGASFLTTNSLYSLQPQDDPISTRHAA